MELLQFVDKVEVVEKVSAKGTEYSVLNIHFTNGYSKTTFLNEAEKLLLERLV